MPYNQAVNVMGFAYHYFTIKPGLFEAQGFVLWMKRLSHESLSATAPLYHNQKLNINLSNQTLFYIYYSFFVP